MKKVITIFISLFICFSFLKANKDLCSNPLTQNYIQIMNNNNEKDFVGTGIKGIVFYCENNIMHISQVMENEKAYNAILFAHLDGNLRKNFLKDVCNTESLRKFSLSLFPAVLYEVFFEDREIRYYLTPDRCQKYDNTWKKATKEEIEQFLKN